MVSKDVLLFSDYFVCFVYPLVMLVVRIFLLVLIFLVALVGYIVQVVVVFGFSDCSGCLYYSDIIVEECKFEGFYYELVHCI